MPICRKCDNKFPSRVKIDGTIHFLNRRKFCLDCSPFGMHNTLDLTRERVPIDKESLSPDLFKKCPKCTLTLHASAFYISKRSNGQLRISGYCRTCMDKVTIDRQRKFKSECIKYKGGKCEDCGFIGYDGVFDFHHLDPAKKDIEISKYRSMKFDDRSRAELDKCVLLCSNCHRIRHAKLKGLIKE